LADTSHQISCGEVKQLVNRHNISLSVEDYLEVIRSKTALLFAASSAIGAMLTDADKSIEEAMYAYGLHLGNAFQLIDDALDYCGDEKSIGKHIGDDLADGKMTMPLLHVLETGTPEQRQLIRNSLKKGDKNYLPDILLAIEATKAIEFTKQFATREMELAMSALQVLPETKYKQALQDLAEFAVHRAF
jgi:octaprenyl-diphosphate synthase